MGSSKVYSVSQLLGNKIKPTNERFGLWMLLENLDNDNLVTDVGKINYAEGEQLLNSGNFTSITDPFCDNIMLVKISDFVDCEKSLDARNFIVKKEMCSAFNMYLRGKFSKYVSARHGVKAKLPFLLGAKNKMAKGIRDVIGKEAMEIITKKYPNPVAIPYKVELADVKLETLLEELPEILRQLQLEGYYLLDLDITQDFAGIFNKIEMCEYLTNNFNFRYPGEYKDNCNVIVDNDKTVGIDCLTWLNSNARVKIYNKFICQITSPGVNKQIGNHIIDFLNCPDQRLKETFSSTMAKQHGITRLEATIYNYNIGDYCSAEKVFNPLNDCISLLGNSRIYFQTAPIYSVPLAKMWTKLTDSLQNSCCVVFNNMLQYAYWGNKNTRKLTGLQIKLPENRETRNKMINYALSAFSFNYLPINYVEIVEDESNKGNVNITQKCYIKAGETFFSRSSTIFSTISIDTNIENMGLVNTNNVIPQVLRKRTNKNSKLSPYPIKEVTPPRLVYTLSAKKRKLELDEIEAKKRKMEYLETTLALKEEHKDLLEKDHKIKERRERLTNYFKSYWKNLDTTGIYKVSGFTVNNNGKYPLVGVLAEKDGIKNVYFLRGIYKNTFINVYNNREGLNAEGYISIPYNGSDLISLATEESFLTFKTNGITSFNGHSFAKVEEFVECTKVWQNVDILFCNQEESEQISSIAMLEIKGNIKVKECRRLEELDEGIELVIRGIKLINYRKKIRYILQFENLEALYISNYWLEKEIQDRNIDLNYKIKIKIDKIKTTASKHKEREVFCV
jgi:hypothetical protein